jgi:organic radical activating enzyme
MTDQEYQQQVLDPLSASFCGAKWYNATIWLGSGQTTSCHHPPAHQVTVEDVIKNPKALHNTDQKKQDRADMQAGRRPAGCEYCWKIEDMGRDAVSDRVYKSKIYDVKDLTRARQLDPLTDIDLQTLEIAFDRTCQFACSYCNPAFSTTWVKDIKSNGPYTGLISDGRNHFTHPHDHSQLYSFTETNPYIDAFFAWWESDLHRTLKELRITGGEPLMSGHTWRLIDWFKNNQGRSNTRLAINSNLGFDSAKMQDFVDRIRDIPLVDVYTSCEAVYAQAEYIRDGMNFDQWYRNVQHLLNSDAVQAVHVMCTINALCLDTLPLLLNRLLDLKYEHGKGAVSFTLNILRFPSFQSALVLPNEVRQYYVMALRYWYSENMNNKFVHEHELNHVDRLIDYLDVVKTPHSEAFELDKLRRDFKKFYIQYDQRRGKDFGKTFWRLRNWFNDL